MKIVFFGDSITDMGRNRDENAAEVYTYGVGYPLFVSSELFREDPFKYRVINRGVGGNRVVDLYARIKGDVWNLAPDVLSILIGINDVWHEIDWENGVDLDRFERVYGMMIEDTLKRLPNTKIVLLEPFVLKGSCTTEKFGRFQEVYRYAEVVKKLAERYCLYFLPLQEKFNSASEKFGVEKYLFDGVHPNVAGAALIADAWVELFREKIQKDVGADGRK